MSSKQSVYQNVAVRWKAELEGDLESVLIFSPFITAPTSETVTQDLNPEKCEIYTLFDAETFASGASSLRAVKKLFERGFALYHLPGLHAKVVLTSKEFGSIGSQNLTGRGTRSLEASSLLVGKKQIREIKRLVEGWIKGREKITLEMIADMEELLKPILKLFVVAQEAAAEINVLVNENEKARQEEKRISLEKETREAEEREERERTKRLLELQKTITESIQAQSSIYCRVQSVGTGSWYNPSSTSSLMADKDYSFLRWYVNSKLYPLERLNRYVCLIEKSGKFGWARVAKTRMTFFNRGVDRQERILLGGISCKLRFSAVWPEEGKQLSHNLIIWVKPWNLIQELEVHAWFSLNSVELLAVLSDSENDSLLRLKQWVNDNSQEFKREMLKLFLDSFTYEESLAGVEAGTFFGNHWVYYKARLHLIEGRPLFVMSQS